MADIYISNQWRR